MVKKMQNNFEDSVDIDFQIMETKIIFDWLRIAENGPIIVLKELFLPKISFMNKNQFETYYFILLFLL